jgi:hypothetical protein
MQLVLIPIEWVIPDVCGDGLDPFGGPRFELPDHGAQ